jgi:beta-lactamase class A
MTFRALPWLLIALPACTHAQNGGTVSPAAVPVARADSVSLHRTLDSLSAAHRGVVGYSILNIETGERFERRGDEPFPTASLIKVPILVTLYDFVEKGDISLSDRIIVTRAEKVGGSGTLQFMHDGIEITVGDAAWLMIGISDNTATNLVLDKVGLRRVWTKMEALGLPRTKVHSQSFRRYTSVAMDSSVKYGLGVSTPNEMLRLFALLAEGKAVSPKADSAMLNLLAQSSTSDKLTRHVSGVRVAHKSGEVDASKTECALFYLQSRVVACVFTRENQDTRWVIDNEAQVMMSRIGEAIVSAWPRKTAGR